MLKRESRFPGASRRTHTRGSGDSGRGDRRRGRVWPVLLILFLAGGLYIYEMPGRPWAPYLEQLQHILSDREDSGMLSGTVGHSASNPAPESLAQVKPVPQPSIQKMAPPTVHRPQVKSMGRDGAKPIQLDIPIGFGFRPVGFRIGAVSQEIHLAPQPGKRMHRLPRFSAPQQRYGVIRLAHGQEYGFALDLAAAGYRMFLDRNRNGDLRDDGEPLLNQGEGLFAAKVILPLARVSGIPRLKGEYRLWLFTNPDSWKKGKMRYYAMTQLRGELVLSGQHYTAYLADNGPVDGDYRNDGISIDLNDDGKISRGSELFPPGEPVAIDGTVYNFRIIR
ncbi:MAG: hypothetical protein GY814_13110 [Gammaproteobacteria bacterium]|nr:hypothetical protein [Gammaproteobacteria bacterium]